MKMEERFVKVNELLKNEAFLEELRKMQTDEEVAELFCKEGASVSVDDVKLMCEESAQYAELCQDKELDESELDDVSGGLFLTSAACFALAATSIAFYIGYGHSKYKSYKRKKK